MKKPTRLLSDESQGKRTLLLVAAGSLCLATAFVAFTLLISSCSARIGAAIGAGGDARISVDAELPAAIADKFRKLARAGGQASGAQASAAGFFDVEAIRKTIAARPGISRVTVTQPSLDSIRVEAKARSVEELAASADIKTARLISVSRGAGWTEFRITLDRGGAKNVVALFPGLDPTLLEALSPPALEDDPLTIDEYRTMLKGVLGERAMAAMEAASIKLSIEAPGAVLASGGGKLSGSTITAAIPILDLLALSKPIELWIRW